VARLFGTDGVRGVYGEDLTDDLACRLGHAAVTVLGGEHPRLLIGRDTRASGPALERALSSGIVAAGGVALTAGVMPTAGVAHLVVDLGVTAGAVISASHNPARDNGIKFFGPDGMKVADEIEDAIEAALDGAGDPDAAPEEVLDADERYERFLLEGVPPLHGMRIVVDCANGAASNVAPEVYRRAGADVTALFCDPDGTNINDGCGSTHPEVLQRAVVERGAHLGIAHDGDADRMLAVDAHGRLVDGDQLLGICALDAKERGALLGGAVVTTAMANIGLRRAMATAGIALIETQVGDRYVLKALQENGLVMGGEQSGHILFLDRHSTGDGILTALRVLSVIERTGRSLDDLAGRIPRFPQVMLSVPVRERGGLDGATAVWDAVVLAEKELGEDGRVLVRASGTEPVVRVMAEAPTDERARAAVDHIARAVTETLG
jgi:phosphoglucosamine mutase